MQGAMLATAAPRTCLALALGALSACQAAFGDPHDDAADEAARIDAYVRALPYLPAEPPQVDEGQVGAPVRQGEYQCVTQDLRETRQYDRIVAYAANSDSLWPGALVAGDSVYSGLFTQMVLPRQPATISVSLENLVGGKSAVLAEPSLSAFREAIGGILAAEVDGATPANIYSEIEQVHAEEQLALALGAEVSWLGSSARIAASFNWSQQDVKSRYLVRYTQAYYTVDLDAPGRPSDVFAPEVTLADVATVIGPENPPLYVSSITYGRMVVFTFESEYSAEELGAALEFAYAGGVDVSGDVSVSYRDIISRSRISAFILGGSGGEAARTIDSYDALIDFIKAGGNYSKESPGAPIAYKLAYLRDNAPGRLSFTTDYAVTDCVRVSQKVKVTLKSIRVDDAGGDWGDDLEIYGSIWAESDDHLVLFQKGPNDYVQIRQGQAWPTSGFISEGIVQVTPQPGNQIRLRASLMDRDGGLNPDDSLGNETVVAPYELGWRRDAQLLLTGDGARVVVTIGLQPI
jgi:thiol-activated cytolysin